MPTEDQKADRLTMKALWSPGETREAMLARLSELLPPDEIAEILAGLIRSSDDRTKAKAMGLLAKIGGWETLRVEHTDNIRPATHFASFARKRGVEALPEEVVAEVRRVAEEAASEG